MIELELAELFDALRSGQAQSEFSPLLGQSLVVTTLDSSPVRPADWDQLVRRVAPLPAILVARTKAPLGSDRNGVARLFDLVLPDGDSADSDLEAVATTSTRTPIAAVSLTMHLRSGASRGVEEGLVAESAVYSTLQGGPEFASWRAAHPPRPLRSAMAPEVLTDREDGLLSLTLNRPDIHNAFTSGMRDALTAALEIAVLDPSVTRIRLHGAGPSFCSGGYLDEFGSRPDPATAHLVRLTRSAALLIARLGDRIDVHLHGHAIGAGIELAAFAGRVNADSTTSISLPELGLGLIPGAGGTVSLPRRIGRWRTLLLALSQRHLDAATALEWGLVDSVGPA